MKTIPAYFLGGNTVRGFVSLYEGFEPPFLWIIKGGPGCGKSTFMKSVADCAEYDGLAVERIFCSGDPDSLDAVYIPAWQVGYMDGTAPHCREAEFPAANASYLDLGQFYDTKKLRKLKKPIMQLTAAYKASYQEAYRLLGLLGESRQPVNGGIFLRAVTCKGLVDLEPKTAAEEKPDSAVLVRNPLFPEKIDGYLSRESGACFAIHDEKTEKLLQKAVELACPVLQRAKKLHDELESVYHPYVDFSGVLDMANRHAAMHRREKISAHD